MRRWGALGPNRTPRVSPPPMDALLNALNEGCVAPEWRWDGEGVCEARSTLPPDSIGESSSLLCCCRRTGCCCPSRCRVTIGFADGVCMDVAPGVGAAGGWNRTWFGERKGVSAAPLSPPWVCESIPHALRLLPPAPSAAMYSRTVPPWWPVHTLLLPCSCTVAVMRIEGFLYLTELQK